MSESSFSDTSASSSSMGAEKSEKMEDMLHLSPSDASDVIQSILPSEICSGSIARICSQLENYSKMNEVDNASKIRLGKIESLRTVNLDRTKSTENNMKIDTTPPMETVKPTENEIKIEPKWKPEPAKKPEKFKRKPTIIESAPKMELIERGSDELIKPTPIRNTAQIINTAELLNTAQIINTAQILNTVQIMNTVQIINNGNGDGNSNDNNSSSSSINMTINEIDRYDESQEELKKVLNRRRAIVDRQEAGVDHKPLYKSESLHVEFREYSAKRINQFRELFKQYDTNNDDLLDLCGLKLLMEKIGSPQTHLNLKKLVKIVDDNGDGKISFRQFLYLLRSAKKLEPISETDMTQLAKLKDIDVEEVGILGAARFFEAKIENQLNEKKHREQLKRERDERRIEEEELIKRRKEFEAVKGIFDN